MALSGRYTTLDTVFNKLSINTGQTVEEADAIEWVAEILSTIAPQEMLLPKITDGNPEEGHPNPLAVTNYRSEEMPCDLVVLGNIYDIETFRGLRGSFAQTHSINMSSAPDTYQAFKTYTPDIWVTPNEKQDPTFQVKGNRIYTNFETGGLIVTYWGWPMDDDENLMVPADPKILKALTSFLQYKLDYRLWRNGDIADKVFQHSEQQYLFDMAAAQTFAKMPSEGMMESISQFLRSWIPNDHAFNTHFTSVGRSHKMRIQ